MTNQTIETSKGRGAPKLTAEEKAQRKAARDLIRPVTDVETLRENVIAHLEDNAPLALNVVKLDTGEYCAQHIAVKGAVVTASQFAVKLSTLRGLVESETLRIEKAHSLEWAFPRLTI